MQKNGEGDLITDSEELKSMVVQYYMELFSSGSSGVDFITRSFPRLDAGTREDLGKEVLMEETMRALKGVGSYKASGPDGCQAIFFKRTWHITGEVVYSFGRMVLEGRETP